MQVEIKSCASLLLFLIVGAHIPIFSVLFVAASPFVQLLGRNSAVYAGLGKTQSCAGAPEFWISKQYSRWRQCSRI
jgi:hypothetical protein